MTEILLCVSFAYLLIGLEAVVPGGILGLLGFFAILASAYFAYLEYGGWFAPTLTFLISGMGAVALLFIEFKWMSNSEFGKNLFLDSTSKGQSNASISNEALIGQDGEILTDLHPEGMILVNGRTYDAVSEDGFLSKGTRITISGRDDFRVRVQRFQNVTNV